MTGAAGIACAVDVFLTATVGWIPGPERPHVGIIAASPDETS